MSLSKLSITRPIFITCIVFAMLIMGYFSLTKMSVDMFPDVTFPVLFIQTAYPGASPLDVEKQISKPIEDELMGITGIKTLSSNNLDSVSVVIAEFTLGTNIKEAEQTVREKLANIKRKLPDDAEDYVIRRFDPADQPIMQLAVSSKVETGTLYDILDETVKPQFEKLEGVGLVQISGGRKREIHVNVDKHKLQDRSLSLLQVVDKIKATSKDVPIGKVEDHRSETVLRASGEFTSLADLSKVNVSFLGSDRPVLLNEIAEVKEGLAKEDIRSTLNGQQATFLSIFKQSGTNSVKVVDSVVKMVPMVNDFLKKKNIDAEISIVRDGSKPIRLNIQDVKESIIIGILLCVVVVFFFLGSARSTFITGMALPNSLLGAFILMFAMSFSINIMTLLALSLAVGLLIDDAIVVRENIFRRMELGEPPMVAAETGTAEVTQAVIATSLVVIAVFGPIAFLDGIIGQFFKQFGLTIVFAMLISMFDAFTVAPMLSAYLASPAEHHKEGRGPIALMLKQFNRFQDWLEEIYIVALGFSIRRPLVVLASATAIFIGSFALLAKVPKTFLPQADNGEFQVSVETKPGTSLENTAQLTAKVDALLRESSDIEIVAATTGNRQNQVNQASVYVRLKPRKQRQHTTSQVKTEYRSKFESLASEGIIHVGDVDIGGGNQKPFNLSVTGENLEELTGYVEKLKEKMKAIPGLVDLDTNFRLGQPEFQVVFDRAKAEELGVSTATAGSELRYRVEGGLPATFRKEGREYDVRVRLEEKDRDLRSQMATTFVPNTNFNMIPLTKVATGQVSQGYSQINRQNKIRFIQIDANLGPNAALDNIMKATEKIVKEDLPPPPGINYAFKGQAQDFQDLMTNMLIAIFLGVVFIYLVLSSLYESFILPLSILLALPLAICGAFAGLFVTGKSIDIFSLIGIVMLLGVVAKNSILLVDYANQQKQLGKSRAESLILAGRTRLRPILMTSFALIAGTIPIAIGLNEASAQRTSMGVAIIGGLISSTLLTLLVVPASYGYIDRLNDWVNKVARRMRGVKDSTGAIHEVKAHGDLSDKTMRSAQP